MFDVVKKACQMCDVQPATHLASASREYDPDRLATEHLWLIDARLAAFGFLRSHPLWPDAYQNAAVALVKASRRYQPKRGSFESYARVWVDNTIRETVCRGGVVRVPVKKALRRVQRGERAALPTVPYLEVSAAEDNASHHRMMLAASATRCPDEEDAMVVRVDKRRTVAWLESRLGELTAAQRAAVLAKLAGTSLVDFAARAGMHRDTALQRTKEGLEYLRAEARGAMTTENPTTTKELTNTFLQAYATRITKELSEQLQVERGVDEGTFVLRFRYGKASEPFKIQGKSAREQLRDLGVHIERFLGART